MKIMAMGNNSAYKSQRQQSFQAQTAPDFIEKFAKALGRTAKELKATGVEEAIGGMVTKSGAQPTVTATHYSNDEGVYFLQLWAKLGSIGINTNLGKRNAVHKFYQPPTLEEAMIRLQELCTSLKPI